MFVMLRPTTYLLVSVVVLVIHSNISTSANRISRGNKDQDNDESDDLAVRKSNIDSSQSANIFFPSDEEYKNMMKRTGKNQK